MKKKLSVHVSLSLGAVVLGMFILTGCAGRRDARTDAARGRSVRDNLIDGALLLTMYAVEHDGRYPPRLDALEKLCPLYDDLMKNPEDGDPFLYLGDGLSIRDDGEALLIAPDDADGLAVTVGGRVRNARKAELARAGKTP